MVCHVIWMKFYQYVKNKIHLIEDCAQSHFSKYKGKNVGNFGIASAFSFFPTKTLGAFGDAGCVITNNKTIEKRVRLIANNGKKIIENL